MTRQSPWRKCVCGKAFKPSSLGGHQGKCDVYRAHIAAVRTGGREADLTSPDSSTSSSTSRPTSRPKQNPLLVGRETEGSRREGVELHGGGGQSESPTSRHSSSLPVKEKREEKRKEEDIYQVESESKFARVVNWLAAHKQFLRLGFEREIVATAAGMIANKREARISDKQRDALLDLEYAVRERKAQADEEDARTKAQEDRMWHPLRTNPESSYYDPNHNKDGSCKICDEKAKSAKAAALGFWRDMKAMYDKALNVVKSIDQARYDQLMRELGPEPN